MEYRVRVTDYKPTELNYPVVGKGTTGVPLFVLLDLFFGLHFTFVHFPIQVRDTELTAILRPKAMCPTMHYT
ncbi:hypothetical protein N7450_001612 [Penicillium hetheringtonii]|uniref:Uncharacterized protein n=1 Tax=Penicillium hetheringtonii TaxID=911720 RepID=A0AAD6E4E7_9EURO|nr:hypothetical protein N7450_001612 [Penicillium hetheringtonii]